MSSWKSWSFSLALLVALASPLLASNSSKEEGEEPDDPIITGKKPAAAAKAKPKDLEADDAAAESSKGADPSRAPWAWPWSGSARSPEWTQDWTWANTHIWMIDVGHVELNLRSDTVLARRSYDVDNQFRAQARIGLLPHIELLVGEVLDWRHGDHVRQEGNEIGARIAFWDYGTIPLNPSLEAVWHPRHDAPDAWEGRLAIGGEIFSRLFFAGNGFFGGETGGNHDYIWGVRGAVAFELIQDVLRVGAEGGVQWRFNPDQGEPFRDTTPTVGPTVLFRPLALGKSDWGRLLKLTLNCEFGIRDDNANVPFLRGAFIIGVQF